MNRQDLSLLTILHLLVHFVIHTSGMNDPQEHSEIISLLRKILDNEGKPETHLNGRELDQSYQSRKHETKSAQTGQRKGLGEKTEYEKEMKGPHVQGNEIERGDKSRELQNTKKGILLDLLEGILIEKRDNSVICKLGKDICGDPFFEDCYWIDSNAECYCVEECPEIHY